MTAMQPACPGKRTGPSRAVLVLCFGCARQAAAGEAPKVARIEPPAKQDVRGVWQCAAFSKLGTTESSGRLEFVGWMA